MPPVSLWPPASAEPGLYLGWHGPAWAALQLEAAGTAAAPRAAILGRLKKPARSKPGHIGSLIGTGAGPLIAAIAARGDRAFGALLPRLLARWIASASRVRYADLTLGSAGALLTAAEIDGWAPGAVPRAFVRSLARATADDLAAQLRDPRGDGALLGLAHGLSGLLLGLEAANATFGVRLAPALRRRAIDAIASERALGPGGSAVWPERAGGELLARGWFDHGWCNGAPGIGLAFLAARRLGGGAAYARPARMALEAAARLGNGNGSFCCGSAGRAQILLEAGRTAAARKAAAEKTRPSRGGPGPRSLFLGSFGRTYLSLRLRDPRLPLPGLGPLSVPKN